MSFITVIFFGILSACFALMLELLVMGISSFSLIFLETFSFKTLLILFGVAFIEEISKYLFLRQYALHFFAANTAAIRNTALLGTIFGIGFAIPEIFLVQYGETTPLSLALLGTISLHIATSVAFAITIFSTANRRFPVPIVVSTAVAAHMIYNFSVLLFP